MTKEQQATDEKPAIPGSTVSDTITPSSPTVVGPTLSPEFTDDEDHIALYLNGKWFALIWWATMVSHMLCVIFLGSCTAMYIFISQPEMIYYNKLLGSDLRNQMKEYGYIFVAMGGLHCLEMLKMIWCSLRSRRLEFRVPKKPTKIKPVVPPSAAATTTKTGDDPATKPESPVIKRLRQISKRQILPKRLSRGLRRFGRVLVRWKVRLFDRKQGFFGIESPYFNVVFLLREGVEIASQSYQMYQCSALISRQWINVLFLAITVCNCWSTPILQHALARYNALERSICLSIDGAMDAGTCMIIPTIIVLKYVRAFDRELVGFPVEYLNDPAWFVDMILENRMLYAMSKADLFSTIVPHYSLFGCVRKVKNLIYRMPPEMETAHVQYINYAENNDPNATKMRVSSLHRGSGKLPGWRRRFVHFFFVSWGLAVLVTHLRARQVAKRYADITACSQQLRPWYSNSFVCATYEFDCAAQGHVDTINASDFALVHSESLSALIISNCPALEMPTEIQHFSNILKFMVYNSSIVSWTTNASINAVSHPSIISICVLLCNVTRFPDGLLDNFPQALQDVQFAQTNLTTLPTDLDQKWQPVTKIFFEDCSFTEFPPLSRT
ncbi:hypothetical protein Poli38472_002444 [Pythium oligandrum]|uniref:Uncharacterized protein n=1 Tax=Pythium oligandrum TaxID=41045 RepID=A0A8K1CJC9_PYTOL|nr:hypothetical protein Poli38472_002444 [Pythium oligandrum]|eukprot:TMW63503.1 hypothetical protein Poli38472_002444 [Pythium oligandrum]